MKNLLPTGWGLLLLWLLGSVAQAQDLSRLPGDVTQVSSCYPPGLTYRPATTQTTGYNPNGYAVTMQGELHVLLVYAGFTQDINSNAPGYTGGDWPQDDNVHPIGESFPANAGSISYASPLPNPFSATATDGTFSNLYYQMTQHSPNPLKLFIHTFPKRINIAGSNAGSANGAISYTDQVLQALKTDPATPAFDFSQVDRRTNHPNFQFDNSQTGPDGIVDFVIVVWRTRGKPFGLTQPVAYSNGGIASVGYYGITGLPQANSSQTYSISATDGFTQSDVQYGLSGLERGIAMHEFVHCFSQSPHYLTAHGVAGTHFYMGQGPGMMAGVVFSGANAWERWYNGWAELRASGSSSDIQTAASLASTGGVYTLRDFITTGDMMRIRLPGSNQYLWLENHTGQSVFDNRHTLFYDGQPTPQPFPPAPRGLVATIVDITDDRSQLLGYSLGSNGVRAMSAQGSFDYTPSATTSTYNNHLFGNQLYDFASQPNPFGGHNQTMLVRMDRNGDNYINWAPGEIDNNEQAILDVVNGQFDDGLIGPAIAFNKKGQKMGISYNPPIFEHQTYDDNAPGLSTIKLNGMSVEILDVNSVDKRITIKVRYDDVDVVQDTRWAGDLTMTDVVPGSGADVRVSGATLTINKSGTANRHTLTAAGDFINPTRFVCAANTTLTQDAGALDQGSTVHVTDFDTQFLANGAVQLGGRGTSFVVDNGALLDLSATGSFKLPARSQLTIAVGGTLVIRQGATVSGSGTIDVQRGAYVCLENGINWQTSSSFTLNVSPGAAIGTNPALTVTPAASCSNTLDNYCGRLTGGNTGLTVSSRSCGGVVIAPQPARTSSAYTATPNPATDQVVVRFEQEQAGRVQMSVQDMQGQSRLPARTYQVEAGPQVLTLSVREVPAGIYLLVVEGEDGRHVTRLEVSR